MIIITHAEMDSIDESPESIADEDILPIDGTDVLPIPEQPWLNMYYWQGARDVVCNILGYSTMYM